MIIYHFFNLIVEKIRSQISNSINLAKILHRFPTCKISESAKVFNVTLGDFNLIFEEVLLFDCTLGAHTYVQKRTTIVNAKIGKFCSIGPNVSIGPGIHKINCVSTHPSFFLQNNPLLKKFSKIDKFESSKETLIGNDVWIGHGAIILDGVKIDNGAIIAAGAVVTKDVLAYSIVAGVPAKHIKFRFDDEYIQTLQRSEWWDYKIEWFEQNHNLMSDVVAFSKKINK